MATAEENYKRLRDELNKRLEANKQLAAIADKIAKGKADFNDTSKYSHIVSQIMGDVISENIGSINVPLGKELVCKELLREHYDRINGVLGEVQASVDDKLGIHLNPQKAPFPTERVDKAAHSLEDPTVPIESIERRAKSVTENIAESMHDDYIKENASWREQAGLDCYLVRDAGGGCCSWCQALEGRYPYATAPDDVFRRHDNCHCTVTYECGRKRQQVWSKQNWSNDKEREYLQQLDAKKLAERKALSDNSSPTVLTRERAKNIEYMSKSFRPDYSDKVYDISVGNISISTKKVNNSEFDVITDIDSSRRNKAVRLVEKNLKEVQKSLPEGFEMPTVAIVDFEKHSLNAEAIGGYYDDGGILFINSKYDTAGKVLQYVNEQRGQFANKTELAPLLHELGHKFYEDSVKALAKAQNIEYNIAKDRIDEKIFDYIHSRNDDGKFVMNSISRYADAGFSNHKYTEIIAECFSVRTTNPIANEIIELLRGDLL